MATFGTMLPRLYHPIDPFDPSTSPSDLVWIVATVLVVIGVFYALGYRFRSYLGHRRRS